MFVPLVIALTACYGQRDPLGSEVCGVTMFVHLVIALIACYGQRDPLALEVCGYPVRTSGYCSHSTL